MYVQFHFIALSRQTACAILNVAVTLCSRALDAEQTWHAVLSKIAACFPIYADVRNSKRHYVTGHIHIYVRTASTHCVIFKGPISRVSQPTFTVRVMTTIRFLLLATQCKHSVALVLLLSRVHCISNCRSRGVGL